MPDLPIQNRIPHALARVDPESIEASRTQTTSSSRKTSKAGPLQKKKNTEVKFQSTKSAQEWKKVRGSNEVNQTSHALRTNVNQIRLFLSQNPVEDKNLANGAQHGLDLFEQQKVTVRSSRREVDIFEVAHPNLEMICDMLRNENIPLESRQTIITEMCNRLGKCPQGDAETTTFAALDLKNAAQGFSGLFQSAKRSAIQQQMIGLIQYNEPDTQFSEDMLTHRVSQLMNLYADEIGFTQHIDNANTFDRTEAHYKGTADKLVATLTDEAFLHQLASCTTDTLHGLLGTSDNKPEVDLSELDQGVIKTLETSLKMQFGTVGNPPEAAVTLHDVIDLETGSIRSTKEIAIRLETLAKAKGLVKPNSDVSNFDPSNQRAASDIIRSQPPASISSVHPAPINRVPFFMIQLALNSGQADKREKDRLNQRKSSIPLGGATSEDIKIPLDLVEILEREGINSEEKYDDYFGRSNNSFSSAGPPNLSATLVASQIERAVAQMKSAAPAA